METGVWVLNLLMVCQALVQLVVGPYLQRVIADRVVDGCDCSYIDFNIFFFGEVDGV